MVDTSYENVRELCSGVFSRKQVLEFDRKHATYLWIRLVLLLLLFLFSLFCFCLFFFFAMKTSPVHLRQLWRRGLFLNIHYEVSSMTCWIGGFYENPSRQIPRDYVASIPRDWKLTKGYYLLSIFYLRSPAGCSFLILQNESYSACVVLGFIVLLLKEVDICLHISERMPIGFCGEDRRRVVLQVT